MPATNMTTKVGQIYREYRDKDYGNIIRWKITQLGKNVAVAVNQATLKEMAITKDAEGTFTWQCQLMENES